MLNWDGDSERRATYMDFWLSEQNIKAVEENDSLNTDES